jgi:hypothetical protein
MPDVQLTWPKGIADIECILEKTVNKELIQKVQNQLVIGSEDVKVMAERSSGSGHERRLLSGLVRRPMVGAGVGIMKIENVSHLA